MADILAFLVSSVGNADNATHVNIDGTLYELHYEVYNRLKSLANGDNVPEFEIVFDNVNSILWCEVA